MIRPYPLLRRGAGFATSTQGAQVMRVLLFAYASRPGVSPRCEAAR